MGSNLAGVWLLWNRTKALFFMARILLAFGCFGTFLLFFYGFQRWREAFCLRVFCYWHGLESCWCFGLSNLTLTRADETLSSHRSESTFRTVFCFAWQRLDCCWRSGVSEPKLCFFSYLLFFIYFLIYIYFFLWVPKQSILSACFLLGMGSNLAGVSVFSNLTLTRLWAAIVRNPRSCLWLYCAFRTVFLLGRGSTAAGVRCFGTEALFFIIVFYGFQRWREAFCLRVFCLAWARILLVFWSFRIWRWRDFEQPSFGIHGVRVFRNRTKALFFIVFLYIFSGF